MADDPTPTPSSEPTPNPNPAPSEPPANPTPAGDPPADKPADPAPEPKGDDLDPTALGGGDPDPKPNEGDDPEPPKAAVPETYELTVPEGFEKLDDQSVADATPVFRELGLTNEQANKLVPIAASMAKRIVEQRDQQFLGTILEQRKEWLETAKADSEIGGSNWDTTMRDAARFMDAIGAPKGSPLRVALDESGFGNHPELIRAFAKGGKAIGEDSDFVRSDANAAVKPKSDSDIFYGSKD